MAPDAEHAPASSAEKLGRTTIAGSIAGDLLQPVFPVVLRHAAVPPTTVPKAAVDEDGKALAAEDEIGPAGQWSVAEPTRDAGSPQDRHQLQLGGFIDSAKVN